jgi:hypothetical protein
MASIVAALDESFSVFVVDRCPTHVKVKIQKIRGGIRNEDVGLNDRDRGQILVALVSKVKSYEAEELLP